VTEEELARLGSAVIRDIPDAVIYADRSGAIRFWNEGAVRIFGFSPQEALGQSLDLIIPERLRKRHWTGYDHMMETGHSRYGPDQLLSVPAQTKSGETLSIQFTVTPVLGQEGRIEGIAAILRDVTPAFQELKRLRGLARERSE
jgi:PAS domain S-box-containing protein